MSLSVAVLLALMAAKYAAVTWLDILNIRNVRAHSGSVPQAFSSFMDARTYEKAAAYTIDKTRFGIFENTCNTVFLALLLLLWIIPMLFDLGMDMFGTGVLGQAITLVLAAVALSLPELPFELYSQFVIEQEYGFNKSTFGLWVADKIKSFAVGLVLGTPIIALILLFSETFRATWWLWGFFAVAVFQAVMIIAYPRIIMPLFNKVEDLPEGDMKAGLLALADRAGFRASTISVIDGSKRSSHSNAFFTGFGRFRRIVLFDTLLEQLERAEIEAVLAHEIGHYRRGHIIKMMALNFAAMFLAFAAMGLVAGSEWFYVDFGFCEASGFGPVLLMFSMFAGFFTFWLTPALNAFSRSNEYEADAFAAGICGAESLKSALRKLHKKNLGNLTPHPVYSAFYYSHPTLLERESALDEIERAKNL